MADNHAMACILGMMDCLWFHQTISVSPKNKILLLQPSASSSSTVVSGDQQPLSNNSSTISNSDTQILSEDNFSSVLSSQEEDEGDKETTTRRLDISGCKTRSNSSSSSSSSSSSTSSSPISTRKRRSHVYPGWRPLDKSMSCKGPCELELQEVQGFMDLGFTFHKQQLNKRMMSVIPGLQRLHLITNRAIDAGDDDHRIRKGIIEGREFGKESQQQHEPRVVNRPYLSEAWLIRTPDSPLLNLRIPQVSTAKDMKKHLKYWAKTVAYTVQLQS